MGDLPGRPTPAARLITPPALAGKACPSQDHGGGDGTPPAPVLRRGRRDGQLHPGRRARGRHPADAQRADPPARGQAARVGRRLFDRLGRKVVLTDAGQELLGRAQAILAAVGEAERAVRDSGEGGRLRVGAIPTIAPFLLPAAVAVPQGPPRRATPTERRLDRATPRRPARRANSTSA